MSDLSTVELLILFKVVDVHLESWNEGNFVRIFLPNSPSAGDRPVLGSGDVDVLRLQHTDLLQLSSRVVEGLKQLFLVCRSTLDTLDLIWYG